MAHIKVVELTPIGSDLFSGSENFMTELTDQEFNDIMGGLVAPDQPLPPSPLTPVVSIGPLFTSSIMVSKQISQVVQTIQLRSF